MATDCVVTREGVATLEFVESLHEALGDLATCAPSVPASDLALFSLAVIEIATNIASHGSRGDEAVTLRVELSAGEDLRAILRDSAAPVDFDPAAQTMVDALAESGRGLALAAAICDELSVERRGGNVWRLVRRIG